MSSDVRVARVSLTPHKLRSTLQRRFPMVTLVGEEVRIRGEALGTFRKRGDDIVLSAREEHLPVIRWVGWAISQICKGSEAKDEQSQEVLKDEPHESAFIERIALNIRRDRLAENAADDGSSDYISEAQQLLNHLVKEEKLELVNAGATLLEPISRILRQVSPSSMLELEDLLLESDDVEELFADATELYRLVYGGEHLEA